MFDFTPTGVYCDENRCEVIIELEETELSKKIHTKSVS